MTIDTPTEAEVCELVEIQHGVMQKEIYHAVLTYIAEPGDASDVGGEQDARQTAERQSGIDHRHEGMAT